MWEQQYHQQQQQPMLVHGQSKREDAVTNLPQFFAEPVSRKRSRSEIEGEAQNLGAVVGS